MRLLGYNRDTGLFGAKIPSGSPGQLDRLSSNPSPRADVTQARHGVSRMVRNRTPTTGRYLEIEKDVLEL